MTLRPATVCGYAPRLRLDLTVNILTNHAVNNGRITVFGGEQLRPNIHIEDMTDLYLRLLEVPDEAIDGKVYNAGYDNLKVREIAEMVRGRSRPEVEIVVTPTDDHRSYHVSSERIRRELGFEAEAHGQGRDRRPEDAFDAGKVPNAMSDDRYYNIKRMQASGCDEGWSTCSSTQGEFQRSCRRVRRRRRRCVRPTAIKSSCRCGAIAFVRQFLD